MEIQASRYFSAYSRQLRVSGAVLLATCWFTGPVRATQNYTATVNQVQWSFLDSCLFFSLVGVTQADPINPNSPWFAVVPTQTGFSQVYAMLLSGKLAGSTIYVVTTGSAAGSTCGSYAGVAAVMLN